jgi:hypothetical protein
MPWQWLRYPHGCVSLGMTVLLYSTWRDIVARYYWPFPFNIEDVRNKLCHSNATATVDSVLQRTWNILRTVLSNIHRIFSGQYWAISSEYSVDSIDQYPPSILWTVLTNILRLFCGQYWPISSEYSVDSIDQYLPSILGTVLSNIHRIFCGQYCAISIYSGRYSAISII